MNEKNIPKTDPPQMVYAGVLIDGEDAYIAIQNGEGVLCSHAAVGSGEDAITAILEWFDRYEEKEKKKVIAVGIVKNNEEIDFKQLSSELWLALDIVPYTYKIQRGSYEDKACEAARAMAKRFSPHHLIDIVYGEDREVHPHRLCGRRYLRRVIPEEQYSELKLLAKAFNALGARIAFFSATPRGGGVAIMRHALIRLLHLFNVDAHWFVLAPDTDVFEITKKKFHNVLQAVASPPEELTDEDKKRYEKWSAENAITFREAFRDAHIIVIDDPQPAGLIPYIRRENPKAKIVYRSHIQIDTNEVNDESTVAAHAWRYLWNFIQNADLFVAHPVPSFVPKSVPKEKILFAPATTDPLDGLNKPLTARQMDYYGALLNSALSKSGQTPLDFSRSYIVQIARFDPAKGIPDVLEAYRMVCERLIGEGKPFPQLVIAGHGSIDDPEGRPIYEETLASVRTKYRKFSDDIKVIRLHSDDQILNTLARRSRVAYQLSHKEGFEFKVTEMLHKGIPVVAYRSGGIPLQIEDGVTGYLLDTGDIEAVADKTYLLLTDDERYRTMSAAAENKFCRDFLTAGNATSWLSVALHLLDGKPIDDMRECRK